MIGIGDKVKANYREGIVDDIFVSLTTGERLYQVTTKDEDGDTMKDIVGEDEVE